MNSKVTIRNFKNEFEANYHAGGDWPYSAIRSGDYRLIENLEDNSTQLFNLKNDLGEKNDLNKANPVIASKLYDRLKKWRENIDAQMPTLNPNYDPTQPAKPVKKRK